MTKMVTKRCHPTFCFAPCLENFSHVYIFSTENKTYTENTLFAP